MWVELQAAPGTGGGRASAGALGVVSDRGGDTGGTRTSGVAAGGAARASGADGATGIAAELY